MRAFFFLLYHALHGLFREAVVHQRVKVHPLRLRQLAGLGHHRFQPLQRRARHHGRGVPRVDLPVTGGDGLQRVQIGVRELVDDGLRHLPVGVRFTKLYRYMDADFAKEHPYIHLSADGEDMIFQITALFITDTGFDYIDPNPMGSKLTEFFQTVEKKNWLDIDGVTFSEGDSFLTLSTCCRKYDKSNSVNQRLVVMAKLLPEAGIYSA